MRGFKVFALVFGLCGVVFAIAAPYAWRGLKSLKEPITDEFKRIGDDATAFAGEHEQLDCAPEAFRRIDACDGVWCKAQTPIFTQECLKRAQPSPTLCDEIPDSVWQAAFWPTSQCREIETDPDLCRRILLEVLKSCGSRRSAH
ncbi:MAG TPA: hypothetical protein VKF60_19480 [Myxococcota bacterium]|nr:hypothetical protein [Myxococcota bacterium]